MSRYKVKGDGTPEVNNARSKLDGLLQTLVDKKEESPSHDEGADQEEESSGSVTNTPTKRGSQSSKGPSRKRRRGKEDGSGQEMGQYHHTYVMKLFDRSVDLAQFDEDMPLYPICRAWMRNQPHNRSLVPRERSPTPGPADDNDDDEEGQDVYKMPDPLSVKIEPGLFGKDLRVPSPTPPTDPPLDIYADPTVATQPERLLLNHMNRWKGIRQKWRNASNLNEMRYAPSMTILKDMFDRQCKDQ